MSPPEGPPVDPPLLAVRELVARALAEDVLPIGDLTASLVPEGAGTSAAFVSRHPGVLAGRLCAIESFTQVDRSVEVQWLVPDGSPVEAGTVVATVTGPMRSVLTAERTALNLLCHLSGVASLTRRFVDVVAAANPDTRILDTRKTTPGLRALEKAAVRAGGGYNHRGNLSEAILVKDNHLGSLTITSAVERALWWWPGRMVEVECDRYEQVLEAVAAGAGAVLLDNMDPDQVKGCVAAVRERSDALIEVSGGVSLETAPLYAAAGADLISVGALTHSAPVLDLGLDLIDS